MRIRDGGVAHLRRLIIAQLLMPFWRSSQAISWRGNFKKSAQNGDELDFLALIKGERDDT